MDGVVANNAGEEEKFSDVRIDTDGEIASVSFDYIYHSGEKAKGKRRKGKRRKGD
jgi:hypothetical protein